MDVFQSKPYRRGRVLYNAQAALEYLTTILASGSFLAYLTGILGIGDGLTGIISSFVSLGCLFQLISLFIRPRGVKTLVLCGSIVNEICFLLLYVFPMGNLISRGVKIGIFVATIFMAYFIYNIVHPKKISWLMSLVSDDHRGRFTATKEMISLVAGIIFSFVMGQVVDYFDAEGQQNTALIIGAAVIFVLSLFHTLSLVFTIEPTDRNGAPPRLKEGLHRIWQDTRMRKVVVMFILWNIAHYAAAPFYGTYLIKELGMSLSVTALLTAVGSVSRIVFSVPMGMYADKVGFAKALRLCLCVVVLALVSAAVATPSTGLICFLLHNIFHGIAMSGINSALTNLIFDYVSGSQRADALAISQATAGVSGFVATLVMSALVTAIQNNGNAVLGIPIYAQQVTSIISVTFTLITILYLHFFLIKKDK